MGRLAGIKEPVCFETAWGKEVSLSVGSRELQAKFPKLRKVWLEGKREGISLVSKWS